MGAPDWWKQRRFGLMIHTSVASVPAWAPIGAYASWYRAHLDGDAHDVMLHPSPLAETTAHHHDRWAHVETYDDFVPFLSFDEFDPDGWTALARDAGMSYVVGTAKHHDGLCWWDAPGTARTTIEVGPRRNVIGELAAATERAGLVFGTSYSLLDWADPRYPTHEYVEQVLHPQVVDLVERYGSRMLWGDGHWGAGADHWRTEALLKLVRDADPDIAVNNRWGLAGDGIATFEYRIPQNIVLDRPFEVRRGIGSGFGYNRIERDEHLLSATAIVALLTEVVAKGGSLLLGVGADASGRIPELASDRLRAAGGWIRRHAALIERGRPWEQWGDDECRYLVVDGVVHVVDIGGRGRFAALTRHSGLVRSVVTLDGAAVGFEQTDRGLQLDRQPRRTSRLPAVYRLEREVTPDPPVELFSAVPTPAVELAELLADAEPGTLVQLGDGRYVGPARIPAGVTVRGLGPERTVIDGAESTAVTLDDNARLEHCAVLGGGERIVWLPTWAVAMPGSGSTLIGCHIDGHVTVTGDDARIRSCRLTGVVANGVDRVDVCRSTFSGMQWDCAIDVDGGSGHVIEGNEIHRVLQAVRLRNTVGAVMRGNQITSRWWGVHLIDTEASTVAANAFSETMRAVDVDGGTQAQVTGNAVSDGDSGCVVQRGASDVEVSGNHWERCRVGLFAWDAGNVRHHDNTSVDLLQPADAVSVGP